MTKRQAEWWTSQPDLHGVGLSPSHVRNTLFDMSQDVLYLISRVEELEKELCTYKSAYKAEAHWRADETRHKEKAQAENERLREILNQVQADTQYIWWE
jgi:hypothetical protein